MYKNHHVGEFQPVSLTVATASGWVCWNLKSAQEATTVLHRIFDANLSLKTPKRLHVTFQALPESDFDGAQWNFDLTEGDLIDSLGLRG